MNWWCRPHEIVFDVLNTPQLSCRVLWLLLCVCQVPPKSVLRSMILYSMPLSRILIAERRPTTPPPMIATSVPVL